jgi:hypothetical protein
VLNEFARHVGHLELQLECAWKLQDWTVMRERLPRYPLVDTTGQGKIWQCYLGALLCVWGGAGSRDGAMSQPANQ